ncbi:MAG: hypothetical protein K0M46_03275, partial [Thiobacillus sp.]|nr:hypothetical protein [Thiobacillus sp.]
ETPGSPARLTQTPPPQGPAFYPARGFSPEAAERYARECVFMTVVRNIGERPIQHNLANWRYVSANQPPHSIRSKVAWEHLWKRQGVAESARIAFTWAQFPATQTFAPDDWNQGMTAYSVPRDVPFDLRFVWHAGGKPHSGKLEQLRCADETS